MNPQSVIIDTTTLIQGFKITNGGNVNSGGGIYINNCGPKLDQLSITSNISLNKGGGLFIENTVSDLKLINSSIIMRLTMEEVYG